MWRQSRRADKGSDFRNDSKSAYCILATCTWCQHQHASPNGRTAAHHYMVTTCLLLKRRLAACKKKFDKRPTRRTNTNSDNISILSAPSGDPAPTNHHKNVGAHLQRSLADKLCTTSANGQIIIPVVSRSCLSTTTDRLHLVTIKQSDQNADESGMRSLSTVEKCRELRHFQLYPYSILHLRDTNFLDEEVCDN